MNRPFVPPPATTAEALAILDVDTLRPMAALLPKAAPRPARKADLIAAIEDHLSGDRLCTLWAQLDETQQLAVREALDSPHATFEPRRFQAKYGKLPRGLDRNFRLAKASRLHFFLYVSRSYEPRPTIVPADIAERLRAFVPPPPAPRLAVVDELPEEAELSAGRGSKEPPVRTALARRDRERTAQHDLLAVLRLIEGGRVAVGASTRRPSAAACQRVAEVLADGDYYDAAPRTASEIGPIMAFAWPWLVQGARLADLSGSKLALTRSGRAALRAPAPETLRTIWKRWMGTTLLDEFSRIDAVKGQTGGKGRRTMTAASHRRSTVADALAECPVGRWVRFDDFGRFMQAAGFDFVVNRNLWNLYIGEPGYGALGHDDGPEWTILEGRYVLCLLFEYAATLGLVDVAYTRPRDARSDFTRVSGAEELTCLSRYDGLHYFRLNALGAYCLDVADSYAPSAPSAQAALAVHPDLSIHAAAPPSPDERALLETYASAEVDGVWRLHPDRALAAIEGGRDPDEFRKFLAARDDQPLPETVEGFLLAAKKRARALAVRTTALLVDCADADIAARLTADKRTAKLCIRAGDRLLAVPAASEEAFRKAARALGYGMPPR